MAAAERLPSREDLPAPGARVHLMGVGGAGMRGLAVLLTGAGYQVSGCDRSEVAEPGDLREHGVELLGEHDPEHVRGCELLVRSSAVPEDHPEVESAREAGIPVMKRGRALGAVVNDRRLVAVSGTHGKTTVTALTAVTCRAAGLDPAAAVGGRVGAWSGYAVDGAGRIAVVEADEYDRSFLELDPSLLVITSLEPEHLESYGSYERVKAAYRELADRAAARDGVIYCADDAGASRLAGGLPGASGYGFAAAEYRLEGPGETAGVRESTGEPGGREPDGSRAVARGAGRPSYTLRAPGAVLTFSLSVPGTHNAQNAAAALAVALELGADPERLRGAVEGFRGVGRRLELLVEDEDVVVVDDYAHHPTEVTASLDALRSRYPDRRLVVVFQPHLYSRTRTFAGEFAAALSKADRALVLPIYPSREEPIPGVTSDLVAEADAAAPGRLRTATEEEVVDRAWVAEQAGEGPAVLVYMGAGDVTELAHRVAEERDGS